MSPLRTCGMKRAFSRRPHGPDPTGNIQPVAAVTQPGALLGARLRPVLAPLRGRFGGRLLVVARGGGSVRPQRIAPPPARAVGPDRGEEDRVVLGNHRV